MVQIHTITTDGHKARVDGSDVAAQTELEASASIASEHAVDELVDADLLVEDVSIDGMCGVY